MTQFIHLRHQPPSPLERARELVVGPLPLEVEPPFRPGLAGLDGASHVVILSWFHHAPRNLIVQKPRHAAEPKGVFALRSPARPNPVGLHVAKLLALDLAAGLLTLDAIDLLDGTPVIDLKPYYASIDAFPDATGRVVSDRTGRKRPDRLLSAPNQKNLLARLGVLGGLAVKPPPPVTRA